MIIQQTILQTRQIFNDRIGYQVGPLPQELGRLQTPTKKRSPRNRSQLSSNSKFRQMVITGSMGRPEPALQTSMADNDSHMVVEKQLFEQPTPGQEKSLPKGRKRTRSRATSNNQEEVDQEKSYLKKKRPSRASKKAAAPPVIADDLEILPNVEIQGQSTKRQKTSQDDVPLLPPISVVTQNLFAVDQSKAEPVSFVMTENDKEKDENAFKDPRTIALRMPENNPPVDASESLSNTRRCNCKGGHCR